MAERDITPPEDYHSKRERFQDTKTYISPTRTRIDEGINLIKCYLDDKYLTEAQKESIRLVISYAIAHIIDLEKPSQPLSEKPWGKSDNINIIF